MTQLSPFRPAPVFPRITLERGTDFPNGILLIEDQAIIALDLERDLESWGYDVVGAAHDEKSVLQTAEKYRPDLAIVDVSLGEGVDGIDIAKTLKKKFAMKIIFLTAHSDLKTRDRIVEANPFAYLFKPYSSHALQAVLETVTA